MDVLVVASHEFRIGHVSAMPASEDVARRIQETLCADEAILRAALERARKGFDHRGLRGEALKRSVRDVRGKRLPRRYRVGAGEVIDRYGGRSSQLDVIVVTDDQPFIHEADESGTYIIEGAAAVGEVKRASMA